MSSPDFRNSDSVFKRWTPKEMWEGYFQAISSRIIDEHRAILMKELRAAREQAYTAGKAEAEIRGDGVPYRPEAK